MSYINWGQESPEQLAIRRRIEEQQHALYEQAIRAGKARAGQAPGVAGGGGTPLTSNPRAITISAKNVAVWYYDEITGAAKLFIVNYEDLTFSEEIVLDEDYNNVDGISFRELVNDRGWIIRKRDTGSLNSTYFFVDAGGNLIEKVYTGSSQRSDSQFDGVGAAVSYTDPVTGKVTAKWWAGDVIYTKTFENVTTETVSFDWFDYDDATIDGAATLYYTDSISDTERVYLFNLYTGTVKEITNLLTYKGENTVVDGMHSIGNFMFATFLTTIASNGTASYDSGTDTIILSSPNPNIKIGDQVSGPSITPGTYITNIVGTTMTLDQNVTGDQTDASIDFNGNRMDLLRIIRTDGTYTDFDLLQYNAWGIDDNWLIGSNKLVLYLYSNAIGLPNTLISVSVNGTGTEVYWELINKEVYPGWNTFNTERLQNGYGVPSPAGAESFGMYFWEGSTNDGKMERYSALNVIWTNVTTGQIYTYEPTLVGAETFGFRNIGETTAPALIYVNEPSSDYVQLLQLKQDGTTSLTDTVTLYADTSNYFDARSLGDDYVLLTHYDDNQAPTNQFWSIWDVAADGFVDNDWFFTTTDNFWGTNYDTFWMAQNTEDKTYWWNSSQGGLGNLPTQIVGAGGINNGTKEADFDDGSNRIDFHQTGTTLIAVSPTQGYLLNSDYTPPARLDLNGDLWYTRLNATHLYNLWPDAGNGGVYVLDVYDLEGTKVQTITTALDTYNNFDVIGDRVYLTQADGSTLTIYAVSPTTFATKTVEANDWSQDFNDWWHDTNE
jgi:hypothetical protein